MNQAVKRTKTHALNTTTRASSKKNQHTLKPTHGFSLVELLVVVAILAILAAIAIPLFLNQRGKAKMGALRSDMRNFIASTESVRLPNNTFPDRDTTRLEILESVDRTTSPNAVYVIQNCSLVDANNNGDWDGAEVSNGNYTIYGFVPQTPGSGQVAPNTNSVSYDSRTSTWKNNSSAYTYAMYTGSPCNIVNGGGGYSRYTYDGGGNFVSSLGG